MRLLLPLTSLPFLVGAFNSNIGRRQSPGAPFANGTDSGPSSDPVFPSPNVTATGDWTSAVNKARAFVAQLTLEEKVNLTTGIDIFGRCVGNTGTIPRLGFNGLCLEDSPLGVRLTDYVSAFPAGINAAMTWDKDLIQQRGAAMGFEHRNKGVNVALGPMMNMGRVAAGGRNWEGFGADPFLTGLSSSLTVLGIQSQGVIACAKHLVGNEQEHFRGGSGQREEAQSYSSDIDDRTMHEVYLWPFGESVRVGVGAVMCAYNRVNGSWACESSKVLNGLIKEELDFKGFMLSDWAALVTGAPPALAGVDLNMPGFIAYGVGSQDMRNPSIATNSFWGAALVEMVKNGTVPEWRVDDMVTRTMSSFFKMGQDQGYPGVNFNYQTYDTIVEGTVQNEHVDVQNHGKHAALIRSIGSASVVLLKNNGVLPIRNIPRNIAIIGSDAGPNPDGPNGCENGNTDRGCSQGTLAMGWGSGTADFPYLVDPLSAISAWIKEEQSTDTTINYLLSDFNLPQAAKYARQADLCMVFVNSDSGEGYITVDNNAGDRNNITLWHGGDALIAATTSQCNNTVVVIHAVGPVLVESWIDNPNVTAVLFAGLPGQESGNGLVDVLKGDVVPSGRLPFTIAKDPVDYPAQIVYTAPADQSIIHIAYSEALEIDYRHFDAHGITPRFEFGFGLSYTKFQYSGLSVSKAGSFGKRSTAPRAEPSDASNSDVSTVSSPAPTGTEATATASGSNSESGSGSISASSGSVSGTATGTATASLTTFTVVSTISGGASTVSSVNATATVTGPIVVPTGDIGGSNSLYDTAISVTFTIRNTGSMSANEVPQVYVGFPASAGEPPKVLRGFQKTMISKGSSKTVTIKLRNKDISIWDVVQQAWVIPAGEFNIMVGASSRDIRLSQTFSNGNSITMKPS